MKLLFIHNRYRESGGEHVVADAQVSLLEAAGHTLEVVETANESGLTGAGQFMLAPWNPFAATRVARAAGNFQPDVAYIHNTWFALSPSVFRALERLGVPTVMVLHNYRLVCASATLFRDGAPCELCLGRGPGPGVRHRCYRGLPGSMISAATIQSWRSSGVLSNSVDAFVVFTDWMKDLFVTAGIESERIHVIPHSTEDPGPREVSPSESSDVVYLGRLSEEKGILELVRDWDLIGGGLRLVVGGDGPLRQDVESAAEGKNVVLLGQVERSRAMELLLSARCLVMPARWREPFGLVLIEAMAAGLPIITTDAVLMESTIRTSSSGWVVSSRSEWRDALLECADGPTVDGMGARARALYERDYTPDVNLLGLERLFASLVEKR